MTAAVGRLQRYHAVHANIRACIAEETDWSAALASIACELHGAFDYFAWTGFYRVVKPGLLVVGPYQGTHGCTRIPFGRGICGAAARSRLTQRVDRVADRPEHIACSSSTQSEIVVPVLSPEGAVLAVLDVDSNLDSAFTEVDQEELEHVCRELGLRFPNGEAHRG